MADLYLVKSHLTLQTLVRSTLRLHVLENLYFVWTDRGKTFSLMQSLDSSCCFGTIDLHLSD